MGKIESRLNIYDPDNDFSKSFDMTLTCDLERWLKVNTHPFSKGSLQASMKQIGTSGKNVWSRQVFYT